MPAPVRAQLKARRTVRCVHHDFAVLVILREQLVQGLDLTQIFGSQRPSLPLLDKPPEPFAQFARARRQRVEFGALLLGQAVAEALRGRCALGQRIQQFADEHQFALVETFAERLASCLQHEFPISWLQLRVRKPGAVPQAASVGLEITRGSLPKASKDSDP